MRTARTVSQSFYGVGAGRKLRPGERVRLPHTTRQVAGRRALAAGGRASASGGRIERMRFSSAPGLADVT